HQKTFEWGRANFLQEARTLARFEHPSIVRVTRVFEANSTAYMVMRFEQGQSFEAWLTSLGRPPTQEELDRIATPLLEALQMMHAERPQSFSQLRPMLLGQSPPPPIGNAVEPPLGKGGTRPIVTDRPLSSRWLAIAAALAVVLGRAYGGYEYSRRQPDESATRDAETKQLAALIEVRRKEAADAAQRQVEYEAERRRKEAAEVARRQAELEAERQRKEAAEA